MRCGVVWHHILQVSLVIDQASSKEFQAASAPASMRVLHAGYTESFISVFACASMMLLSAVTTGVFF